MGNDVNPLSAMLIRPRLNPPSVGEVAARLGRIDWERPGRETRKRAVSDGLFAFYHPRTLRQLLALKAYLAADRLDRVDEWIRMVALNRLSGHSNGFFSVYTMPPNQAVSAAAQRKINIARKQTPPPRDVSWLILKKTKTLLAHALPQSFVACPEPILSSATAWGTGFINSASVGLIVTSPPFLDVVNYSQDNWLRYWFAGIDPDAVDICIHRKVNDWRRFVRRCFVEFARILRPDARIAFEVGEVRNGSLRLEEQVLAAIKSLPFAVEKIMINRQNFTKTSHCWGVVNGEKGTNSNRILLARRL